MPLEEKVVITHSIITVMLLALYTILVSTQEIIFKQSDSMLYKITFKVRYLFGLLLGVSVLLLPLTIACGLLINLWINY